MTFVPKGWQNGEGGGTPLSAAALIDLEERVTAYAETQPGPQGETGETGATGATGAAGEDGRTILNGSGAPSGGTGEDGDFYIDTAADAIYGPKSGSWGSPTSLIGPQGDPGDDADTEALETELAATGVGTVTHGSSAGTARPAGYERIIWVGTVEPTNAENGDLWIES